MLVGISWSDPVEKFAPKPGIHSPGELDGMRWDGMGVRNKVEQLYEEKRHSDSTGHSRFSFGSA